MNDRTGQVWFIGNDEQWQVFLVLKKAITRCGCHEHMRLILSSNWDSWPGKVAPYPESVEWAWEKNHDFKRIL